MDPGLQLAILVLFASVLVGLLLAEPSPEVHLVFVPSDQVGWVPYFWGHFQGCLLVRGVLPPAVPVIALGAACESVFEPLPESVVGLAVAAGHAEHVAEHAAVSEDGTVNRSVAGHVAEHTGDSAGRTVSGAVPETVGMALAAASLTEFVVACD